MQSQSQQSVESFGWQWSEQTMFETTRMFYRRLFSDMKIWIDHHDGKVVADVGSGTGHHAWALAHLTKASEIISVELADDAIAVQRRTLSDPRIRIVQADAEHAEFRADFIYMCGFIQHTANPLNVLRRHIDNLNEGGELAVSFYMWTPATIAMEPVRWITRRLPKPVLWAIAPLLALPFIVRRTGREQGLKNARLTAYDWFGSHAYQKYFTEAEILDCFARCGIDPDNVRRLAKGLYRVRKGRFTGNLTDEVMRFGKTG